MWLLVLLLQALVWCDYTFNTSTDHMSVASRYTISGQIDPATLPDDYKRGWNGWLQRWNSWLQWGDGVLSDLIGECMTWSAKRSDLRLSLTVKVIKATSGWQQENYISWWQRESGEDIKTTSAECSSAMISFYDDMKWRYCRLDNIHRSKAAVIRWCHNSWGCRELIIMMKWGCDRNTKLKTSIKAKVLNTNSDSSPEVALWW